MTEFRKFSKEELEELHLQLLRAIGREIGVKSPTSAKKEELIENIIGIQNQTIEPVEFKEQGSAKGAPPKIKFDLSAYYVGISDNEGVHIEPSEVKSIQQTAQIKDHTENKCFLVKGIFELHANGYGFIRTNQGEANKDVYVSKNDIKKYNLKSGDKIKATAKINRADESPAMQEILVLNDEEAEKFLKRKRFDDLVPYYPNQKIRLETNDEESDLALRCIDLFAPIGKGQRGLIVAPPKTGKTTIMKMIAKSIEKNYPDIKLIILLIDERPEEVTDFKRSVQAEVLSSTFDEGAEHHVKLAEYVISRAKRLVETEKDVVILMDSITKLARAYNTVVASSGKTLSGGIDPFALQPPKKFFGTARNIENGGSLTIISTALIETGSKMDDVIYEEFKGTGNMEIHLSRGLSEKRIFPAIDLYKSGTRKEELLLNEKELDVVFKIRKILSERDDATESLVEMIKKTKNNEELVEKFNTWIQLYSK